MSDPVYEAGLSRLLDGEMTPDEAAEFAAYLKSRPHLVDDLRRHLGLWEVWSQQVSPERSSDAFAAAWETRLVAEKNADSFCRAVEHRVRAPAPRETLWDRVGNAFRAVFAKEHRFATWASAAAVLALVAIVGWFGATRGSAQPLVTLEGEAVCTHCILHETRECTPALRVVSDDRTSVYYLDRNAAVAAAHAPFCAEHPVRVRATGRARKTDGHMQFEAIAVAPAP